MNLSWSAVVGKKYDEDEKRWVVAEMEGGVCNARTTPARDTRVTL
jgi:hypothetical protein